MAAEELRASSIGFIMPELSYCCCGRKLKGNSPEECPGGYSSGFSRGFRAGAPRLPKGFLFPLNLSKGPAFRGGFPEDGFPEKDGDFFENFPAGLLNGFLFAASGPPSGRNLFGLSDVPSPPAAKGFLPVKLLRSPEGLSPKDGFLSENFFPPLKGFPGEKGRFESVLRRGRSSPLPRSSRKLEEDPSERGFENLPRGASNLRNAGRSPRLLSRRNAGRSPGA
jgi:hypothetical protein